MPNVIYDWNGTTSTANKKVYDWNGTASTQLKKAYDYNGTTNTLVYSSEETVTKNFSKLSATSGYSSYDASGSASVWSNGYGDTSVFTRLSVNCSGYSTLTINGASGTASDYCRIGICVTTDDFSASKDNVGYIQSNKTYSTRLFQVCCSGMGDASTSFSGNYTINVSGKSTVYITIAGWTYSANGSGSVNISNNIVLS